MEPVRPKKHLGQHFLKDQNIANNIVKLVSGHKGFRTVLEIGPGMGVLTNLLLKNPDYETFVVEIDRDSVAYLKNELKMPPDRIIEGDFLELRLDQIFKEPIGVIGNLPYNISSQIFFKVVEHRNLVREVVCMIQKEVAERMAAAHGNKTYGILSVLLQAFYEIKYQFTVHEHVFVPPPNVKSAVITMRRNDRESLGCDEKLFINIVKAGFNQRRKTLRNALKPLNMPEKANTHPFFDKRAEQLSVNDFIDLTRFVEEARKEQK